MNALVTFLNGTGGLIIGFLLTLLIYSYLLGDNPLYRLAVHVLVGVSAAYAAVIIIRQVLLPIFIEIRQNPTSPETVLWAVPLLFALLLLAKRLPGLDWLGNSTLALLIGIGAAIGLVGAITGTLWPLTTAVTTDGPLTGLIVALLTVSTLLTFQFTPMRLRETAVWQPPAWQRLAAGLGKVVLTITLGVLYANTLATSIALLTDRLSIFINELARLLS